MLNLMSYAVKVVGLTSETKAETKVETKAVFTVYSPASRGCEKISEHGTREEAKMFAAAYGEGYFVM